MEAGITPGSGRSEQEWADLVQEWFPQLSDTRLRQVTWPAIAVHRDLHRGAAEGRGVAWRRSTSGCGTSKGLAASAWRSLRRYTAANLPEEARRSQVTGAVARIRPSRASDAQIDYGQLGRWLDPGQREAARRCGRSSWCCACSRHMFVRTVLRMDQRAWTECHVAAFEFFGGVPARLVPDNLRTGVDQPDLYDPKINRSYAELAAHYGCLIDPARSRKPRDKPKVERPMPYVRDSFWRGREFTSPEGDAGRGGTLVARRWPGSGPAGRWTAPAPPRCSPRPRRTRCRPLPAEPFVLAAWARARIGPGYPRPAWRRSCIPCRGSTSARPPTCASPPAMVQLFLAGDLVKTQRPQGPQGKQTDLADYPPEKIAFHMRTPAWCRKKTARSSPPAREALIGGAAGRNNALYRLRAAQGVLHLADKHQPGRLEAACAKAAAAGDPSYRTVKGILTAGTEGRSW